MQTPSPHNMESSPYNLLTRKIPRRAKSFDGGQKSPLRGRRRLARHQSFAQASPAPDEKDKTNPFNSTDKYGDQDTSHGTAEEASTLNSYSRGSRHGRRSSSSAQDSESDGAESDSDDGSIEIMGMGSSQHGTAKGRGQKLQQLKTFFNHSNRKLKRKPVLRQYSCDNSVDSGEASIDIMDAFSSSGGRHSTPATTNLNTSVSTNLTHDTTAAMMMQMHQSSMTLPMANVVKSESDRQRKYKMKTEQIIESLVWFSFHIPRTVLEDLITHEIDLWKQQLGQPNDRSSPTITTTPKKPIRRKSNNSKDVDDVSVSSLTEQSHYNGVTTNFSEQLVRLQTQSKRNDNFMKIPKSVERESALLFCDMSGFTKLSTMLDAESLSKVINAYFDMIVGEVIQHGGDILKFAGDAFFAEWSVSEDKEDTGHNSASHSRPVNPLANLNASLSSVTEMGWDDFEDDDIPKISICAMRAAKCAEAIVAKYSDYYVSTASTTASSNNNNKSGDAMLNVHCGIGVGPLVGLHVADYKEDQEEDAVELRREFLILGDPIDQIAKAADVAHDGEVYASPEAMLALALCCHLTDEQSIANSPVLIASRNKSFLEFESRAATSANRLQAMMQPYESLRMHCKGLDHTALARLHLQMALYVHPVIRGDELALSAAIQDGKISQPTDTLERRHRAEAELRSVFTMFIKPIISSRVAGVQAVDSVLYQTLANIMHVTSRELDRYSGHLRQFIVDDKGVVLIATFGLRGSTFPNMVANNALPAAFAIHRSLKTELKVENRIGCTFGKVYCGVVGGVRRHEFAVMGAPVNLAARLMGSKVNKGILVDEAVREQAGNRFKFNSLPPVQAKGYDKPVPILEPLNVDEATNKKKKSSYPFVGRKEEKLAITSVADGMLEDPENAQSSVVFLMGESGTGKSALAVSVMDDIRQMCKEKEGTKTIAAARSTSSETEQRIPLSSYKQVFLSMIRDQCEFEGASCSDLSCERSSISTSSFVGLSLRSMHSVSRRKETAQATTQNTSDAVSATGAPRRTSLVRSDHTPAIAVRRPSLDGADQTPSGSMRPMLVRSDQSPGSTSTRRLSLVKNNVEKRSSRGACDQHLTLSQTKGLREEGETDADSDNGESQDTDSSHISHSLKSLASPAVGLYPPRSNGGSRKYLPGSLGLNSSSNGLSRSIHGEYKRTPRPGTEFDSLNHSLHRYKANNLEASLHRGPNAYGYSPSPSRVQSMRNVWLKSPSSRSERGFRTDDVSVAGTEASAIRQEVSVPYFEKICTVCEALNYPYEYADIVGSQFLGLESANPVTHVDGHVPTMEELVEFLAQAFICISEYADLILVVLDDFQWVDAFSWKILRVLCDRSKKLLLVCATRSHDKTALRRLSTAFTTENQTQSQMTEVSLGPLDFFDIRALIVSVLDVDGSAVDDDLCTDIFHWTGGLPVFVVQVLENIKRKQTLEVVDGALTWTAEGLKEKKSLPAFNNGAFMEETFLSRFDTIDVRVRKVLQTCAVLGVSFALTDVIQVHPEMTENDIEQAMDLAVDEMILIEQVHDDDDAETMRSTSINDESISKTSDNPWHIDDRFFQFSHAMWRNSVLTTMLKDRKIELHRLIAESMERDQVLVLEQADISRLLTLFEHWKSCGDFSKSAPLALAVGARLEEWDLSAQSLELYEDALELSFDSVIKAQEKDSGGEWVQVKAKPMVLDLILRLHICIGLCHQRLGDPLESSLFFEDAYSIVKSSSKIPGMSKSLMMPIISSLCVLKLEQVADSQELKEEQDSLIRQFVSEAKRNGHPVHICRALALEANYFAKKELFNEAAELVEQILSVYDIEKHNIDMTVEYGSDYALSAISDSVQWLYMAGKQEEAEERADMIINDFLPALDDVELDDAIMAVLPILQVLILGDRAKDADWLLKKYVLGPYNETGVSFFSPLFNPLAYLLELILMEEGDQVDPRFVEDLEDWVLEEHVFEMELERKAHVFMGEICWRLACLREDDDPGREELLLRARELLFPIAHYPHPEIFLKYTAQTLVDSF